MKRIALLSSVACLGLGLPAGASASTPLGETFVPTTGFCDPGFTNLAAESAGNQYTIPFSGVLTSWSYQADLTPPMVDFKVARQVSPGNFRIIAESGLQTPAPGALHTDAVRLQVSAGDVLGIFTSNAECGRGASGYSTFYRPSNAASGTTAAFSGPASYQLDVAAILEPDCDGDGFGDESQDQDLSACDQVPPETTITKQPKDKTKKKQAEFEFTSSEPNSSFQCALDGSAFEACTSPLIEKVGKGKHVFQVRAVDAAGNIDATPAINDWKVKKKRKK